jgi:hypothetical protein
METENRNELIELFGKLFGEAVANEIRKYDSKKVDETNYSEDVKNIKRIIDSAVEKICDGIESAKKEILERIDYRRNMDLTDPITIGPITVPSPTDPWKTNPCPYAPPYTPTTDPLSPLGPVITYSGNNNDGVVRVVTTTTAGGSSDFPTAHTYTSLTAEDIDSVLYSMFGQ